METNITMGSFIQYPLDDNTTHIVNNVHCLIIVYNYNNTPFLSLVTVVQVEIPYLSKKR